MNKPLSLFIVVSAFLLFFSCSSEPSISELARDEKVDTAVALAKDRGRIFVSTVGIDGMPHLMIAGTIAKTGQNSVSVTEWECPRTSSNLINQDQTSSRSVSIVIWDEAQDTGYQLLGSCIRGTPPGSLSPQPPIEETMNVYVSTALKFSRTSHSDVEE